MEHVMKIPYELISIAVILLALCATTYSGFILTGSTIKVLSKNYALVNIDSEGSQVLVSYIKDDGSTWSADPKNTEYTVPVIYEMVQVRHYSDDCLDPW
jgi:hypothetical protein